MQDPVTHPGQVFVVRDDKEGLLEPVSEIEEELMQFLGVGRVQVAGRLIGKDDFSGVYQAYAAACQEEGVVIVNTMISGADGKMFCLNLAPDADAIRRAHDRIGLAFDSITEVTTASPGDIHFNWK